MALSGIVLSVESPRQGASTPAACVCLHLWAPLTVRVHMHAAATWIECLCLCRSYKSCHAYR